MQIKTLRATHPSYNKERHCDLDALAKGGELFHSKLPKFLPQNTVEPAQVYALRCKQAHYTSHMGSIANLYVSWLFAASFEVKPRKKGEAETFDADAFYGMFQANVGNDTTLANFMRERVREAMISKKAYWLAELPSNNGVKPADKKEYEDRGLGRARLREVSAVDVLDWATDEDGAFEWVIVYSTEKVRKSWAEDRDTTVETWRIYDRTDVAVYEIEYKDNRKPSDTDIAPLKSAPAPHGFKRVPLSKIELPVEICIGEQVHDDQLEHFRLDNALSWLIRRTCYAQPIFHLEDGDTVPTLGAGYAIVLGTEDKMGWTSPPTAPFDILQKNVEAKRDEIYRVTHTMAQAVDNNAETVGRSADSKEIDAAATRIMLNAYGEYVSEAIEETFEMISEARAETDCEWIVKGFSGYDTATVSSLLANAKDARLLGIPSETFHKELCNKVVGALFAGEDEILKAKIRKEIESAVFEVSSKPIEETMQQNDIAAQEKSDKLKADTTVKAAKARPKPAAPKKP